MTVRACDGCGEPVYDLAESCRPKTRVVLDVVDHPDGTWEPQPDGRTAAPTAAGGYRLHVCDRPLDGQTALFEDVGETR